MVENLLTAQQPPVTFRERLRILMQQDARYSPLLNVASGKVIYTGDRLDDAIYLVDRGLVKVVSQVTESGKSCLLGIYRAGDVFGETCIVGAGRAAETAIAIRAAALRKMSSARFRLQLRERGWFEDFARHLAMRVLEQQMIITEFATLSSEQRLATTLVRLSCPSEDREHGPYNRQIKEQISCQQLAEMVGTTRSRIGYFLKKFREQGLIALASGCFLTINENAFVDYVRAALQKEITYVPKERRWQQQRAQY
jgi:CRP/FNR family transcriptional regulator, cyclic AMP receptor protein